MDTPWSRPQVGGIRKRTHAAPSPLSLPRRSPDLKPLHYTVWAQINRRMRKLESTWAASKKEIRAQHLRRLCRTVMNLSSSFIDKALGNLQHRCKKVVEAHGGQFLQGGSQA